MWVITIQNHCISNYLYLTLTTIFIVKYSTYYSFYDIKKKQSISSLQLLYVYVLNMQKEVA